MKLEHRKTCIDQYLILTTRALICDPSADLNPIITRFKHKTEGVNNIHPCAKPVHDLVNSYAVLNIIGEYERFLATHDTPLPHVTELLACYTQSMFYRTWSNFKQATRPDKFN